MRINLDEPVSDEDLPKSHDTEDEDNADDEAATDGFVIRRDLLAQRRRRRPPRTLSPLEQRLIAVGLIVVIAVAATSLAFYLRTVRANAERIPASAVSRPVPQSAVPATGGSQGVMPGAYRHVAPPDVTTNAPDRAPEDDAPTEGIH
ncbi:MAG: hypothetical protein FJX72_03490 [Armatimonadetes bacterium]|nr:hypothetical protein [Armatimonadota bacterium]